MPPKGDLQLSIGYWIVSHKQTLRTWWGITLMSVIVLSLLWMVVFFFLFTRQDGVISSSLIGAANGTGGFSTAAFQPKQISVGAVTVIPRDDTHVDLVAEVTNANTVWAAKALTAHFSVDGEVQSALQIFVNQGEHRPVIQVNVLTKNSSATVATLTIDSTEWARASAASLPAPVFNVANIQLTPSTVTVGGLTRTSMTVSANVTNTSVYNYYHVDVPIVLLSGDRIVGVGQVGIDRWPTLTTRPVSLTLTNPIVQATEARIVPQVNRFDAGNTYR